MRCGPVLGASPREQRPTSTRTEADAPAAASSGAGVGKGLSKLFRFERAKEPTGGQGEEESGVTEHPTDGVPKV